VEKKTCCRCQDSLFIIEFSRKKSSPDGRMSFCKRCDALRQGRIPRTHCRIQLIESECSYLAGLIDGEGYIGLAAAKRKSGSYKGSNLVFARMVIAITSPKLIMIRDKFGFGAMYTHEPSNPKHKRRYDWQLRSNEMKQLLPQVLPYLRIRDEQAVLLLRYFDLPRTKDDTYREQVKLIYDQLRLLNKRGK